MSNSSATVEDDWSDAPSDTDGSLSVASLLAGARRRVRANPSVVAALLAAGIIVAGVDWLCLHDPVPTIGFNGIQEGNIAISFGIVITVLSRATTPLSALVGLKLGWLAWVVGLGLLEFVAVVGAGAYALARLLNTQLTIAAILRYAGVVALLQLTPMIHFEGGAILLAVVFVPLAIILLVRLFPFPGLLVAGYPVGAALRQSWHRARGNGWSLFGIVLVVGLLNHLLASVPVVGSIGSAFVGVLHAGTVAAFLHQDENQRES